MLGSSIVAGVLAGVIGTGMGGAVPFLFRMRGEYTTSFLLAASAGVMTSISLLELVPEAVETAGKSWAALGFITGILLLWVLDRALPHLHRGSGTSSAMSNGMIKSGLLIGLGIALHNFPEGVAIGASFAHETSFGIGMALLIAIHNVPEGMAMAIPLKEGNLSAGLTVLAAVAAGLPMGFGAALGQMCGSISAQWLALSLGSAAGAMMYVVCDELIPGAHRFCAESYPTTGLVTGILVGVAVCYLA